MTNTQNAPQTSPFFADCARLLQPDQLLSDAAAQTTYGRNSVNHTRAIGGAILAQSQEEVIRIVALANQHRMPLYPISTGHNWGYGGATPHADHAIILDLHRMRRIISVDRELGVATVEPGVTTSQLYEYLQEHDLPYMVPVTGAGPHNSLIGNALERGFGIVPTSDHFQAVLALKAVLADGRLYQSALAEMGEDDVDHLFKWGVGPYIDGLFSQSGYGVVTQATIALAPKAESATIFMFDFHGESPEPAIAFIREAVKHHGERLSALSLMNKARFASSNPYIARHNLCDWKVMGAIYGNKASIAHIRRRLNKLGNPIFSKRRFYPVAAAMNLFNAYGKLPACLQPPPLTARINHNIAFCDFMLGKPSEAFLNVVVYGGKGASPLNPDLDGKGIIWYTPLVPIRADNVRRFLNFVKPILEHHGFDFSITLVNFGWRCFDGTIPLIYDRTNPEDCARAQRCYEALFTEGKKRGFVPYRVGLQGMKLLVDETQTFWQVTRDIKRALDPNHIMSAGRYTIAS